MRPDAGAPLDVSVSAEGAAMPGRVNSGDARPAGHSKPNTRNTAQSNASDGPVGKVLRSVYQTAVQEDIPAEMLDLLSKLD